MRFLGPEGREVRIESPRKDQEIVGSTGLVSSYTGYVTAGEMFCGEAKGGLGPQVINWTKVTGF